MNPTQTRVVIGTADHKLHVYNCDAMRDGYNAELPLLKMGTVTRGQKGRAMAGSVPRAGNYLGVQGVGRGMEIYRVRDEKEAVKKQKRRLKRKREKIEAKAREAEEMGDLEAARGRREDHDEDGTRSASDELELASTITTKSKMRGFAFSKETPKRADVMCKVAVLLDDNAIQEWEVVEEEEPTKLHVIESAGHPSDIRAVALSPDDETVLSCSSNGSKLWNVSGARRVCEPSRAGMVCARPSRPVDDTPSLVRNRARSSSSTSTQARSSPCPRRTRVRCGRSPCFQATALIFRFPASCG